MLMFILFHSNSIEARTRTQMKRAFWDIFEQTFQATPPNYKQALQIIREIKKVISTF